MIERGTVEAGGEAAALRRSPARAALAALGRHPAGVAVAVLAGLVLGLLIAEGAHAFGQATVNGMVSGSYFALGAVGLTLVYGILKLVNFAHGDFLTFGAFMAYVVNVSLGLPLAVAIPVAMALTAALGVGFELSMWRPMRRKSAGTLQLILMSIGLAFVLRNGIQFSWGTAPKSLSADVTTSVNFVGLAIGRTELIVTLVGYVVLVAVGL